MESLAQFSFQSSSQFCGTSSTMPDGKDFYFPMFYVNGEINRVRPRFGHFCFMRRSCCQAKSLRIMLQGLKKRLKLIVKAPAQANLTRFIPIDGVIPFLLRLVLRDDLECHLFARRRFLISAETSSAGVPRPGCFKASSARRSSSAICSGVKSGSIQPSSSPYSSQTFSMNARFSSVGIGRICSMRSAALMPIKLTPANRFASA